MLVSFETVAMLSALACLGGLGVMSAIYHLRIKPAIARENQERKAAREMRREAEAMRIARAIEAVRRESEAEAFAGAETQRRGAGSKVAGGAYHQKPRLKGPVAGQRATRIAKG